MIEVVIDERACVGCTLCAEVCPTDVLVMHEGTKAPEVAQAAECFGCLSCAEICPAGAIEHHGVTPAPAFYRNSYGAHLAARLGIDGADRLGVPSDEAAWERAVEDLGVRLLAMAEVFERTLGGSLPAVGTMAGKTLSRHLPRYRQPADLDETLEQARQRFSPAWEMTPRRTADGVEIAVETCFVRELCQRESIALGSHLCVLFCNYLVGYVGALGGCRLRLTGAERGERCTYQLKVYA